MLQKTRTISTPDRKKRRKKAFLARMTAGMLVLASVLAGLSWGAHHERFSVAEVSVSGNVVVREGDIEETVRGGLEGYRFGVLPKRNIAFTPLEDLETLILTRHPRLASAEVSRSEKRRLSIAVAERKPAFLWCGEERTEKGNEECYFLDDRGYVFSPAPYFSGNIFVEFYGPLAERDARGSGSSETASASLSLSEQTDPEPPVSEDGVGAYFLKEEQFAVMHSILESFAHAGITARRISLSEEHDVFLDTSDGARIIFSLRDDPSQVVRDVEDALASPVFSGGTLQERLGELESIDVRFGNKVYYRLSDE